MNSMETNSDFDIENLLFRVKANIKDKNCEKIVVKTLEKYAEIEKIVNSNCVLTISENLGWIAEASKNSEKVIGASKIYLSDDVINTIKQFKGDVADEVLTNICWVTEISFLEKEKYNISDTEKSIVKKYINWLNNGHIFKLINIASEFQNGNLKMKKDIFSLLNISVEKLEKFNNYISRLSRKKYDFGKKLELMTLLKDISNIKKDDYADIIIDGNFRKLTQILKQDLGGIRVSQKKSSLQYGIKLFEDMKSDPTILFLINKYLEHGSLQKWLFEDQVTKKVIDDLRANGFDPEIYVASGRIISKSKVGGDFSENWMETFRSLLLKVLGRKRNNILPKVSIYGFSPGQIFKMIEKDYLLALQNDKDSGMKMIEKIKGIINKAYKSRKIPKNIENFLVDIDNLEKVMIYGGVLNYRGAKVVAKVWKRRIPEDLYDSDLLRCCIYLPDGEYRLEIPLFMMDPKTTSLQYFIQGIDEPVAAATFYAGVSNGQPVLLMDTWDAGGLVYSALGHERMKNFVLESMIKFGKVIGAKILVYSKAEYGRPEEFCNYLRDKGFKSEKIYFEAIDVEDSVLKNYSVGQRHHYTDAFNNVDPLKTRPMKGNIEVFPL